MQIAIVFELAIVEMKVHRKLCELLKQAAVIGSGLSN